MKRFNDDMYVGFMLGASLFIVIGLLIGLSVNLNYRATHDMEYLGRLITPSESYTLYFKE